MTAKKRATRRARVATPAALPTSLARELALRDERIARLFAAIRKKLPALENLLAEMSDHWSYEDPVYRFYHQSFKVYEVQARTLRIVEALRSLLPDADFNPWFAQIVAQGTGRTFAMDDNRRWLEVTRPMIEAFFHARYFLEMVCKYARELDAPPAVMPSGWAAVLHFYGLR